MENHDDFFFFEDGRIHVKDQMGYWIVYDVVQDDFALVSFNLLYQCFNVFYIKQKNGTRTFVDCQQIPRKRQIDANEHCKFWI